MWTTDFLSDLGDISDEIFLFQGADSRLPSILEIPEQWPDQEPEEGDGFDNPKLTDLHENYEGLKIEVYSDTLCDVDIATLALSVRPMRHSYLR